MASFAAAASDSGEEDTPASLSRVQDWIASLQPGLPLDHDENHNPIACLHVAIAELYCGILPALARNLGKSDAIYRTIERGYSSLVLWSRDHDVANGNLDAALEHSQGLRNLALRLLINVCGAVLDRLIPLTGLEIDAQIRTCQTKAKNAVEVALAILPSDTDAEESGEDADSFPSSPDSLVRVASDIHTMVGALTGLGPLFEEPIPDPAEHEQPAQLNAATSVMPIMRLIQLMFPGCEDDTARGIAQGVHDTSSRILKEAAALESGDQAEQANITFGQPQKALTLVDTIFHDSALGTSLGAGSLYAETVRSYKGGADRTVNIQLPRMPEEGVDGTPFLCRTCNRTVIARTEAEWKRHLMSDARPYMCIEPSCPEKFLPFSIKATWKAHIASHYVNRPEPLVHCPICGISYIVGGGDIDPIAIHLAHHLEPIAAGFIIDGVTFTGKDEEPVDGAASNASEASSGKGVEDSPQSSRGCAEPLYPTAAEDLNSPQDAVLPGLWPLFSGLSDSSSDLAPIQKMSPECSICGKIYLLRAELSEHMKIHSSPLRCGVVGCTCTFPTPRELLRHENAVHWNQHTEPFRCVVAGCFLKFPTQQELSRHRSVVHGLVASEPQTVYRCPIGACERMCSCEDYFPIYLGAHATLPTINNSGTLPGPHRMLLASPKPGTPFPPRHRLEDEADRRNAASKPDNQSDVGEENPESYTAIYNA